jgi:predicted PurR-regulated permease PerM
MDKQVVISVKTIIITLLILLSGYVVIRLGAVIGIFLVAILIVFAMEPLVRKLTRITFLNKPLSRGAAVAISYLALIGVIVLFLTVWLPPLLNESQKLIKSLPKIASEIQLGDKLNINLADILPQASKLSGNVLTATVSVFSNVATFLSILVIAIYLSVDWINIKRKFAALFPDSAEDFVHDTLGEIESSLGNWIKGELILMLVVGFFSFVGLAILGVSYPLALGLISGFFEVVPMIGPVLSAVVAALIAFADAPIKALGVIALFILIQQLENNLLVPKVMQKVSGFSPLVILLALLVGSEFFGIAGAILAIPMTMILTIVIKRTIRYMR